MAELIAFEKRLDWELTTRCNLRCAHCISRLYHHRLPRELDAEEALVIVERCREAGIGAIHFFGGEPTCRDDLPALMRRADELGIASTFNTNGSRLGAPLLETMASLRRRRPLLVSLEDTREAVQDALRGPGSAAAARRGIRRYQEVVGGELVIAWTLTRQAVDDLAPLEILEFCAELGAHHLVFQDLAAPVDGPAPLRRVAYDGSSWLGFLEALFSPGLESPIPFTYKLKPLVVEHLNETLGLELPLSYYGCDGLSVTFRLLPNGTLLPCSAAVGWAEALDRYLAEAPTLVERPLAELLELPAFQAFQACKLQRGADPWMSPCRECHLAYIRCNPCVFGRLIGREHAIQTCRWVVEAKKGRAS